MRNHRLNKKSRDPSTLFRLLIILIPVIPVALFINPLNWLLFIGGKKVNAFVIIFFLTLIPASFGVFGIWYFKIQSMIGYMTTALLTGLTFTFGLSFFVYTDDVDFFKTFYFIGLFSVPVAIIASVFIYLIN